MNEVNNNIFKNRNVVVDIIQKEKSSMLETPVAIFNTLSIAVILAPRLDNNKNRIIYFNKKFKS